MRLEDTNQFNALKMWECATFTISLAIYTSNRRLATTSNDCDMSGCYKTQGLLIILQKLKKNIELPLYMISMKKEALISCNIDVGSFHHNISCITSKNFYVFVDVYLLLPLFNKL